MSDSEVWASHMYLKAASDPFQLYAALEGNRQQGSSLGLEQRLCLYLRAVSITPLEYE